MRTIPADPDIFVTCCARSASRLHLYGSTWQVRNLDAISLSRDVARYSEIAPRSRTCTPRPPRGVAIWRRAQSTPRRYTERPGSLGGDDLSENGSIWRMGSSRLAWRPRANDRGCVCAQGDCECPHIAHRRNRTSTNTMLHAQSCR